MNLLKYKIIVTLIGFLTFFSSCNHDNGEVKTTNQLELLNSYNIKVAEPSGLAINNEGTILYTVSDNTNQIYKLSVTGNVLQSYNYSGNDLEGVSMFTSNSLLLAEERTKEIVEYNLSTGNYSKHKIVYENNDANSGIEGVAFNTNDNTIFILNEKDPGLLMRLRSNYTILATYELTFASDYSGLFFDKETNNLWIVSDQNKTVNQCSLKGELIKSYAISVTKAEGIAVTKNEIYVVSDSEAKLYVYKKPTE